MTAPRPIWAPTTYQQAVDDVASGRVSETHFVELKELIEGGEQGTSKLRKGLSSFAVDGGVFVIGVRENKQTHRAEVVTPVSLTGLQERVVQVAASFDPTLTELKFNVLRDPNDKTQGVFFVYVDASPWAPHRTTDGSYYGRNDITSYKLTDSEIERAIRLRSSRTEQATTALDAFWDDQADFVPQDVSDGYLAIVATPAPGLWGEPFMQFMGVSYRNWMRERLAGHSDLVPAYATTMDRTSTGIRAVRQNNRSYLTQVLTKVEIDRSGEIRILTNSCVDTNLADGGALILRWSEIDTTIQSTIALANELADCLGRPYGLNLGVELRGIKGYHPLPLSNAHVGGNHDRARALIRYELVPYQAPSYRRTTTINASQARGDLQSVRTCCCRRYTTAWACQRSKNGSSSPAHRGPSPPWRAKKRRYERSRAVEGPFGPHTVPPNCCVLLLVYQAQHRNGPAFNGEAADADLRHVAASRPAHTASLPRRRVPPCVRRVVAPGVTATAPRMLSPPLGIPAQPDPSTCNLAQPPTFRDGAS